METGRQAQQASGWSKGVQAALSFHPVEGVQGYLGTNRAPSEKAKFLRPDIETLFTEGVYGVGSECHVVCKCGLLSLSRLVSADYVLPDVRRSPFYLSHVSQMLGCGMACEDKSAH